MVSTSTFDNIPGVWYQLPNWLRGVGSFSHLLLSVNSLHNRRLFRRMNKEKLKAMLTPDFLKTLKVASECYGWSGDLMELMTFHQWCHDIAGTAAPTIDTDFEMDDNI